MGCKWGFFHEYVLLTSPWRWEDFKKQRKRWLWGNIHAITHRDVLPFWQAVLIAAKYLFGCTLTIISLIAAVLRLMHLYVPPPHVTAVFWLSLITWLAVFGLSGWINSADGPVAARRHAGKSRRLAYRCWHVAMAVMACPLTALMSVVVFMLALLEGNPKRFEVIPKTAPAAVSASSTS